MTLPIPHQHPISPEKRRSTILRIAEPQAARPNRFSLWELGFRPFYLLASAFAALSIPLWALQHTGWLERAILSGPGWHAHEMLFGFTLAVIVGFLFTAGRNWTNQPTPTGRSLMTLSALWLLARVLVITPYGWAAALANVAFPLASAVALAVPLIRSGNRRNYFLPGLLALMAIAAASVHLGALGLIAIEPVAVLRPALDIVLFIAVVMAGRVIPMFTNNGVSGARASRQPVIETIACGGVLLLLLADLLATSDVRATNGTPLAVLTGGLALIHALRWLLWSPWRTRRVPMVWVLHLAYLWIPIHFLLRAFAEYGVVPGSLASHALTTGAIGGLTIGMMTRTARGHTARPVRADRSDVACYLLVAAAALVRVLVPWIAPGLTVEATLVSAGCWSAGFGLYALTYWPVLTGPRLDGRPG